MALADTSIRAYYQTNYELKRRWGFSLDELEGMYPFERDIYMAQVAQELSRRAQNAEG